jgi:hypothetical protein
VVLNFIFLRLPNQKSVTLAFDHLTGGGWPLMIWVFFCVYRLEKQFFLSTWATIASRLIWPFNFFTAALPTDVTDTKCGLVRYFCLSVVFTTPINSAGSELIYSAPGFLELSLSARSCYLHYTRPTHAWSILNLLPACELPSSCLGLSQWLRKIRAMPPQGIGVFG